MRGKIESYYNYLVIFNNEEFRFKMTQEITDKFGIPINSIHHVIKKKNKRKWTDYEILKIKEPVFIRTEIAY